MPKTQIWFNLNSHTIELLGAHDENLADTDPNYWLDSAIVTGEIIDETEAAKMDAGDAYTPVASVSMTYLGTAWTRNGVTYDDGNYRGVFAEDPAWTLKASGRRERHFVQVKLDDGTNRDGLWREPIDFKERKFDE